MHVITSSMVPCLLGVVGGKAVAVAAAAAGAGARVERTSRATHVWTRRREQDVQPSRVAAVPSKRAWIHRSCRGRACEGTHPDGAWVQHHGAAATPLSECGGIAAVTAAAPTGSRECKCCNVRGPRRGWLGWFGGGEGGPAATARCCAARVSGRLTLSRGRGTCLQAHATQAADSSARGKLPTAAQRARAGRRAA
jgi:hypothetical protein